MVSIGPISRSLTTTNEISVDVFSSSYLDVSVGWVCKSMEFSPGKSMGLSIMTARHGVSLSSTSHAICQGIRDMPSHMCRGSERGT